MKLLKDDIKIGYKTLSIKKDLQNQSIKQVYWCPRGKPPGVSPKNPSDVVVQISNDDYIGYSNKISEGKDETPKFNTNMYAYFGKLENSSQLKAAMNIIDTAWDQASKQISKDKKLVIWCFKRNLILEKKNIVSCASSKVFSEVHATVFRAQSLDFYTDGILLQF